MLFENVAVVGLTHVDAPEVIPSSRFETRLAGTMERLRLPLGMLSQVAGVESRRWWSEGVKPSDAATLAAEKLLEEVRVPRERIGLVVNTSVCRDYIEPSTACLVHSKLGLAPHCQNFDLGNACLAFMNAMDIAGALIERGEIEYALVVDGESSRFVQEQTMERLTGPDVDLDIFRQEFATLTLGSGSVAMILAHRDLVDEPHLYRGAVSVAASEWSHLCEGQVDYMKTDTRTLLAEGVKLACRTYEIASEILGWTTGCLDELVLHQVSAVHTGKLCEALGLDIGNALLTFPELGNVGPASVPITLSKAVEAGRITRGSRVGLLGIGSGLNCSMAELVW